MNTEPSEAEISAAFNTLRTADNTSGEWEQAFNLLMDADLLAECGCCGGYHPKRVQDFQTDARFNGGMYECRSNANRF